MHGLLADPLPRRAAPPRWIGAISQDRDRGRCDHDPILVEMVKEFMCVGVFLLRLLFPKINKKPTACRSRSEIRGSPEKERNRGAEGQF